MGWIAEVVYEANGTKTKTFTGDHISVQVWPDGRGMVTVYDEQPEPIVEWLAPWVHSIHKRRLQADHGERLSI